MTTYEYMVRQWDRIAGTQSWYELTRLQWIKANHRNHTIDSGCSLILDTGGKADFTLTLGSQSLDLTKEQIEELIEELEKHDLLEKHDETLSDTICDGCNPSDWICDGCDNIHPSEIASWLTDNLPDIMSGVMEEIMEKVLRQRDTTDIMVKEALDYIKNNACSMRGRL